MSFQWLDIAKQLQSVAQAGLTFSEGKYDRERYEQIREISFKILNEFTTGDEDRLRMAFTSETGYQTPKIDVRGVVFRDDKILMVHETIDNHWSLPGGWCDVGLSPKENVIKEVKEEAGLEVKATRLLAVFDKNFHSHPPDIYHAYKLFILCEECGGQIKTGIETQDVGFFEKNNLPPLSIERNTQSQILKMFELRNEPHHQVYLD